MKAKIIVSFLLLIVTKNFGQDAQCNPDSTSRTQILIENIPNNYTCFMELRRGWSTYYGTGALIHPRVIITAGHNLAYFPVVKRPPFVLFSGTRKVNLYFGSIDSNNYKISKSIKLKKNKNKFFNNGYWINSDISRDFSIIILPDDDVFNMVKGHYKFKPVAEQELNGNSINIIGSPGDKDLFEMWTSSTNNFFWNEGGLHYDLFTQPRNSGSPIWYKNSNDYQLTGVHSRSFGDCNASVFVDLETYNQVVEWCKEAGIDITVN